MHNRLRHSDRTEYRTPKRPKKKCFESGIEQQLKELNQLFLQLDHAPIAEAELRLRANQYLDPAAYKWADNDVYDRIPGIRLVNEQLGSDVTGWIFH